jgi:hypothetical protein
VALYRKYTGALAFQKISPVTQGEQGKHPAPLQGEARFNEQRASSSSSSSPATQTFACRRTRPRFPLQRVCVTFVTCVLTFSRACTPDMSLYVCVYIYMRARQTQVFMYVCIYRSHICRIMSHACQEYVEPPASEIRKHTPIDMCVCICMYVYTYVCMYVCMNVCMYVCMLYIYIYICIHTQTHTHRHTHTHTQKHTHMIYNSHTHKI